MSTKRSLPDRNLNGMWILRTENDPTRLPVACFGPILSHHPNQDQDALKPTQPSFVPIHPETIAWGQSS